MLGREVQTFVNERQSIGKHFAVLNVINLSSGVYFCRASTAFPTAPGHPERSGAESKDELGRPKGLREWPSPSTASRLYRDFAQGDGIASCLPSGPYHPSPGHPERSGAESKDELGQFKRTKGMAVALRLVIPTLLGLLAQCDGSLLVYLQVHTTHPRVILSAAERSRRMS